VLKNVCKGTAPNIKGIEESYLNLKKFKEKKALGFKKIQGLFIPHLLRVSAKMVNFY